MATVVKDKTRGKHSYAVIGSLQKDTLLVFRQNQFTDTFLIATEYYYKVENPATKKQFYVGNFSEVNMLKAVAKEVISQKLLTDNGQLSTKAFNDYAQTAINYPDSFRHLNDSLLEMVRIAAPKAERNMRKAIKVNKFGNLGQGNVVIGHWELKEYQPRGFHASKEYYFLLKNINGGVAAIVWLRMSGFEVYTFNQKGKRNRESLSIGNPLTSSPVSNEEDQNILLTKVTTLLVRRGLL